MKNKTLRLLIGIGVPIAMGAVALIFFLIRKTPPCIFYELTGLYCPGCGAGRAFLSLLGGRVYAAFRYNPLLVISLPVIAYCAAKFYLSFVFGKDLLPLPKIRSKWFGILLTVIVILYWILRNIPVPPFSYLAPTSIFIITI